MVFRIPTVRAITLTLSGTGTFGYLNLNEY
jgi:hypothetical protein